MPVIDQSPRNPYRGAVLNYPQLERMTQQRIAQQQRQQLGEEKLAAQEEGRQEKLGFDIYKQESLERYREKTLALTEKAQKLRALQVETEMSKAEFEMNKEMAQIQETKQQQQEMTKAIQLLGKVNPKQPDFREKIAEIRANYPNAFKQSKNGEETFINDFEKSIYAEHEVHIKAKDDLAKKYGVEPVMKDNGDIDVDATRTKPMGVAGTEHAAQMDLASQQGLKPTGMQETSHGPEWRFGQPEGSPKPICTTVLTVSA